MPEFSISTEALHALVEECRKLGDAGTDDEAHEMFNAALFLEVGAGRIETYQRMRRRYAQVHRTCHIREAAE